MTRAPTNPTAADARGLHLTGLDLDRNPDVVVPTSNWSPRTGTCCARPRSTSAEPTAPGPRSSAETYDRGNGATILLYDLDAPHRAAHPAVPLPGLRQRASRRDAARDRRRTARRRRPRDRDPARGDRRDRARARRHRARLRRLHEPRLGHRAGALLRGAATTRPPRRTPAAGSPTRASRSSSSSSASTRRSPRSAPTSSTRRRSCCCSGPC